MKNNEQKTGLIQKIDTPLVIIPLIAISAICVFFFIDPENSISILNSIRFFIGDKFGVYYILIGIGVFLISMYIAFSKIGTIRLGKVEKQEFSNFSWGAMIFTSTMAADILFYSICEWALYASEPHIATMGGFETWAPTYALFHWGPIPWSFYLSLSAAFGFMFHVKGKNKQRFSEGCRPILGDRVDGILGKLIDLFAVFALLAGTATTFSLATPLITSAIGQIFGFNGSIALSLAILMCVAAIYTITILFGIKGVSKLATICSYLFFALLLYVFVGGGEGVFILETGVASIGNMVQNFFGLATQTDPTRSTSFTQNWTIFYWAYWMVWCIATPIFIGTISKGKTIKSMILGGYFYGIAGTFTSFIVLGNYGLAQQLKGTSDMAGEIAAGGNIADSIINVFNTLPLPSIALFLLVVTMIAFYATTFDALTMVMSAYSYKNLRLNEEPDKKVRVFWAILFILLPMALIFSENSMAGLQSVSIIAAFPIGIIVAIIIAGFIKEANQYLKQDNIKKEL